MVEVMSWGKHSQRAVSFQKGKNAALHRLTGTQAPCPTMPVCHVCHCDRSFHTKESIFNPIALPRSLCRPPSPVKATTNMLTGFSFSHQWKWINVPLRKFAQLPGFDLSGPGITQTQPPGPVFGTYGFPRPCPGNRDQGPDHGIRARRISGPVQGSGTTALRGGIWRGGGCA